MLCSGVDQPFTAKSDYLCFWRIFAFVRHHVPKRKVEMGGRDIEAYQNTHNTQEREIPEHIPIWELSDLCLEVVIRRICPGTNTSFNRALRGLQKAFFFKIGIKFPALSNAPFISIAKLNFV